MTQTPALESRYGMDPNEYAFVIRHNVFTEEQLETVWADIAAGSIERAVQETWDHTVAQTVAAVELAAVLGVSRGTIGRRRRIGRLYAFRYESRWRYPTWQLYGGGTIPGLDAIMTSALPSMHPASIEGLMRTPQPALALSDEPITVVDWLTGGHPPEPVLALIDELAHR